LRNKSAEEILQAELLFIDYDEKNPYYGALKLPFETMFEDEFMPKSINQALQEGDFNNDINLMIGHNEMEGEFFAVVIDEGKGLGGRYIPALSTYPGLRKVTIFNDIKGSFIINVAFGIQVAPKYTETFNDNLFGVLPLRSINQIRRSAVHALGDYILTCPTVLFGGYFAKNDGNVHQFRLEYANSQSICRDSVWAEVTHLDDLPLSFGLPFEPSDRFTFSEDDKKMSRVMMDVFTYFAKNK